ncbi:MAG: KpsF/GutQ family sugar-phosphate isomerase [Kiritimatiellia bacterium]
MKKEIIEAQSVIDCEIAGLQSLRNQLEIGFVETLEAARNCLEHGRKLIVTGVGKSLHIAEKIAATLTSTGSTAVVLNPMQAIHGDLGIVQRADVVLAFSYSGESEELLNLLPAVKRLGAMTVAVTGDPTSTLARSCDIVASVAVPAEACPFNLAPTTSSTASLVWGDALAMVLLRARGFKREDYACLHPAGAIGRALLLRVRDIMRAGSRIVVIPSDTDIKATLFAMTQARTGLAIAVDAQGKLDGVFTDGDLRRNIEKFADILTRPIQDFLTRNPISVQEDDLAVSALSIFESHQIDDLVVVDQQNRPVGVVDIQDLPKFKII